MMSGACGQGTCGPGVSKCPAGEDVDCLGVLIDAPLR
jgi:hypothetical protein